MRGPIRLIEIAGIVLLLIVLAIVGSRVSAESGDSDRSGSSDIAGLVARLRLAGLSVIVEDTAHDPRLSVGGRNLLVNGENVAVYAYRDAWSADADAARLLDEYGDDLSDWIDAPHLFRDDRLLVVHAGGSDELNELLGKLLESGANLHEVR
ncbi:MAG TPA: hypothetical protein VHA53_00605 [Nitrolancea sp.]|nr:hypothetical protein [Nitrolancea sp.]